MHKEIRVRFAPSPTGHLHIGGLRAALFNWLFAKHNNGKFFIRIEDTDLLRSKKEYNDSILESFAWSRLDYEQPVVIQSERIGEHMRVANELIAQGKAFRCFCAGRDTENDQGFYKYDGRCRALKPEQIDVNKPHAIRFKVPAGQGPITFEDMVRGAITFEADQFDDFIIVRSDGTPMYNFVVVIDDAFMKISHVIRGEDHISNTPKQILLYQACGYELPQFGHLPMILGPDGNRLSKRDAATSVLEYKYDGYLPDALCNYLVRLGWSHGDQEVFSREELVSYFSIDHVGKKGAIFDQNKLDWLNSVYMKKASVQELTHIMVADVNFDLKEHMGTWSQEQRYGLIDLYKERVKTVRELAYTLSALHAGPATYDEHAVAAVVTPETAAYLEQLLSVLSQAKDFSHDSLAALIKELCKALSIKLVALAQPIRIALTGTSASPGVFELLSLLGKETSMQRLSKFLDTIRQKTS